MLSSVVEGDIKMKLAEYWTASVVALAVDMLVGLISENGDQTPKHSSPNSNLGLV